MGGGGTTYVAKNISEYLRASQSISEHLRASQSISEHLRTSQSISEHLRASQNISRKNISEYLKADGIGAEVHRIVVAARPEEPGRRAQRCAAAAVGAAKVRLDGQQGEGRPLGRRAAAVLGRAERPGTHCCYSMNSQIYNKYRYNIGTVVGSHRAARARAPCGDRSRAIAFPTRRR
eukprot:SAG31_NODE_4024_length_3655_cov_1.557087_4_plen_177_part_00